MNETQLIFLGLIASVLTFALKVLASYLNYKPSRVVMNVILYIISAGAAFAWAGVVWPAAPVCTIDIASCVTSVWDWLNNLIALAAPIMGSATLIYNILYEKVIVPAAEKLMK